jgi:hypothetical protein
VTAEQSETGTPKVGNEVAIKTQNSKLKNSHQSAFTLVGLMVTVVIVSLSTMVSYMTFSTIITSWRRGTAVTEALHHGDFVMDQLAMGLRSTYFPDKKNGSALYGFWHEDVGSEDAAQDSICWVKQGMALTDPNSAEAAGLHRVRFNVEADEDGELAATARVWHLPYVLPEDFDLTLVEPMPLSSAIKAFDCRVATNILDGEWQWEDVWEDESTNVLPHAIEVTLYIEASDNSEELVVMRRCIEIPVAHLAWH